MTRPQRLALALSAVAALAAGAAGAQISRDGGPIAVTGLVADLDQNAGRFSYVGQAEATQDGNRLRADRIDAYFDGGEIGSGFQRVEAIGDVYFVTPEQVARGDRAVFVVGEDTLTVTGDVILTQGENVLTGSRLVYNARTGQARMEGGPNGGRVQGIFYPPSSD